MTTTVVKERPILFSVTTGKPSMRGKRLRSKDGLSWKQRNREAVNKRRRELYKADPAKHKARVARYKREHRETVNRIVRNSSLRHRARLRAEMVKAYGGKCMCCGESEPKFLQLDHIHNDGHVDRKRHKTSTKLFASLRRLGWPQDRHQLLCANCNFGKLMNGGKCPHKK